MYLQRVHVLSVHWGEHEDVLEVRPALLAPQCLQLLFAQHRVWLSAAFRASVVLVKWWLWIPLWPLYSPRRLDHRPDPHSTSIHHSTCQLCCDIQQPVLSLNQVNLKTQKHKSFSRTSVRVFKQVYIFFLDVLGNFSFSKGPMTKRDQKMQTCNRI